MIIMDLEWFLWQTYLITRQMLRMYTSPLSSQSESDDDSSENIENQVYNDPDADPLCENESNGVSPKSGVSADDEYSSTTEILEMIMVRDVKAGTEIFNTYGSMGYAALLHRYGFTEPDNPFNIVNIDLELVLQWSSSIFSSRRTRSCLSLRKRSHHSEFPTQEIEYFEVSSDGEPEVELVKLIFIILLPEQAYNDSDNTTYNGKRIILDEITEKNKKLLLTESVRGALLSLADLRERCYGLRSMADDVDALKMCPATDKKLYNSLMLRLSERSILEKLRAYACAGRRLHNVCNRSTMRKKLPKR